MAFVDELQVGGPILAYEDLRLALHVDATTLAMVVFTVPMVVGAVAEPALLLLARGRSRPRVVAAAMALMGLCALATALSSSTWVIALAISAWGIGSGLATSFAEVELVARSGGDSTATMSRWARAGALGDLAAPVAYTLASALGLGWRAAVVAGACMALVDALALWHTPPAQGMVVDDDETPLRSALRALLGSPSTWAWLLAATACTLFDEIFVSLATLYLRDGGASAAMQGLALSLAAIGAALGTLAADWAVARWPVRTVLLGACAACTLSFVLWLLAPLSLAVPLSLLVGACTLPMWALATARAYGTGLDPGVVAAGSRVLGPLEILAPVLLGLLADAHGLTAALLCLLLQPLAVATVAWRARR